ncbi:SDR family NAD(P)-dependent oxidoreductase [Nocardia sp. NPDC019395]|uniref:SDR family NAD(P)-dependent oxidoreductase n=1 Tax=Nocardia sp. NPDC019395 TaxID=3154686 RepID=UPI0033FCF7B2
MNRPVNTTAPDEVPSGDNGSAGRVTIVTGGASGMGLSVCHRLAASGDRVAVFDLDGTGAERAADEIRAAGGTAMAFEVDVTDRALIDEAVGKVRAVWGPVQVLVTSAGVFAFEPFTEISADSWQRILDVNLNGTFHCIQAVIPDMIAAGWGRIVTISSSSAQRGSPKMVHYTASKGAVIAMTKALAREYAQSGITVNTIPPSGIDTPMSRVSQAAGHLPDNETMARAIPVGYLGSGEDIAAACVFLCSEDARFITGQVLGVNGGAVI